MNLLKRIRFVLELMNDFRFAFCQLLKSPGFTAGAVLTLAVGIGAEAALLAANEQAGVETSERSSPAYSIRHEGGTAWLIRPNGERFFSLGVCCVTPGTSRQEFDPANPSYAAWQHYADSNEWAKITLRQLKSWGFTTVGGWSDFHLLRRCGDDGVAFAPVLHIGSTAGAPWWDMWDSKITDRMDQVARDQILPLRDDPRVIGYYSDNEMGWWNAILFRMTLEQASTSGQRQRLIQLLRETYRDDWSALLRDFEPAPGVENWDALGRHGLLFLRPGGEGMRVERRFLEALARIPHVIGADWFQYHDEPTHGRYDGENFNFGLVDIHNRPYEALTATAAALDLTGLKRQPAPMRPDASQGVPPAPRNPLAQFELMLALKHWDRERGFVPPVSEFPLADLYVCWSKQAIYLGLYAQDVTEDVFYKDKIVRSIDRAEWNISLNGSARTIRSRIGAGLEPVVDEPAVRLVNVSGLNGSFRNIAAVELPARLFGKEQFKSGNVIEFASTFSSHGRGYRMEWKGKFTLRSK